LGFQEFEPAKGTLSGIEIVRMLKEKTMVKT